MASKYPYSQSSSYIGLLNSQHETVNHENYPYGSFHSSVNLGASEIPPFSSQQPDRKSGGESSQTSHTNVGDNEVRPIGIKAAKEKRSNGQGKSMAEYTTIWEMKKEDLTMKEKLSKLAILDTLLAKKEPLSEAGEMVKNKLLAAYF
ncbi:hypothetical protein YC2023_078094 [Brassica napus]